MILSASDLHLEPIGYLPDFVLDFARTVKSYKAQAVFNGDIFDLLPIGMDTWLTVNGRQTIWNLEKLLPGAIFIAGNHDPYRWMKELLSHRTILVKSYDAFGYHFEHGHRLAPDWRYLRKMAPSLVDFFSDRFPRAWYWLYHRLGWTPGKIKKVYGETSEYNLLCEAIHHIYTKEAIKYHKTIIMGHTHLSHIRSYGSKVFLADSGDLREGTYLAINNGDIQLRLL